MTVAPARIRVRGDWFRITRPGSGALFWSRDPFDARWQRGSVVRGLYLACCPDTAWAEWLRATAEDGVPPAARLPRELWTLRVDLDGVADLASPGALARLRLAQLRPTQRQWAACQAVGEALWLDGAAGLVAPSAAHADHRVLCVFRTAAEVPGVAEVPPPAVFEAIPVIPTGLRI